MNLSNNVTLQVNGPKGGSALEQGTAQLLTGLAPGAGGQMIPEVGDVAFRWFPRRVSLSRRFEFLDVVNYSHRSGTSARYFCSLKSYLHLFSSGQRSRAAKLEARKPRVEPVCLP
jgi:hypothetical protein